MTTKTYKFASLFILLFALLVLLGNPVNSYARNRIRPHVIQSTMYDMDGDEQKDRILLSFNASDNDPSMSISCEITINGKSITISGDDDYDDVIFPTARIVKIDSNRKELFIAVSSTGQAEYYHTTFIGYDGKSAFIAGDVLGTMKSIDLHYPLSVDSSKGVVRSYTRSNILQTWQIEQNFYLCENKLILQQQEVYKALEPNSVKVIKSFMAYSQMDIKSDTTLLKKGEEITLTGTDNLRWVQFRRRDGNYGYIKMVDHDENGFSSDIEFFSSNDKLSKSSKASLYLSKLVFYG